MVDFEDPSGGGDGDRAGKWYSVDSVQHPTEIEVGTSATVTIEFTAQYDDPPQTIRCEIRQGNTDWQRADWASGLERQAGDLMKLSFSIDPGDVDGYELGEPVDIRFTLLDSNEVYPTYETLGTRFTVVEDTGDGQDDPNDPDDDEEPPPLLPEGFPTLPAVGSLTREQTTIAAVLVAVAALAVVR